MCKPGHIPGLLPPACSGQPKCALSSRWGQCQPGTPPGNQHSEGGPAYERPRSKEEPCPGKLHRTECGQAQTFLMGEHRAGSDGEESACNAAAPGSIPGLGRPLEKEMATHSSIWSGESHGRGACPEGVQPGWARCLVALRPAEGRALAGTQQAQWGPSLGCPCPGVCSSAGLGAEGVRVSPWSLRKLPALSPQLVPGEDAQRDFLCLHPAASGGACSLGLCWGRRG